ncbi:pilus assembly protein FimV [Gammaproteobacteria bacterium]
MGTDPGVLDRFYLSHQDDALCSSKIKTGSYVFDHKLGLGIMTRNLWLLSLLLLFTPCWQVLAETEGTYGPLHGEKTLGQIANELHRQKADYRNLPTPALVVALWRANPKVFTAPCNLNTLRKDVILTLPSAATVAAISKNEATAEVKRQSREWRRTRKTGLKCPESQVASAQSASSTAPLPSGKLATLPPQSQKPVSLQPEAPQGASQPEKPPIILPKSEVPATSASPELRQPTVASPSEKPVTPLVAEPPISTFPDLKWLELPENVIVRWEVTTHPQNPHWLQIRLKDHAGSLDLAKVAQGADRLALETVLTDDPTNHEARYRLATLQTLAKDYVNAMENLLEIVRRDRKFRDDGARKALLIIFDLLGADNDLVIRYHKRLLNLLPHYRIFAIISKKSSSYSLGLTKILEVFGQKGIPAEFTVANIDNQDDLANTVLSYAENQSMNLLISIGSESADYLSKNYNHGKIPVITCINKDPVLLGQIPGYSGGHDTNIVYTSLNVPLPIYLSYLKTLRPNLKAVGLMYDHKHKQVMVTEVAPTLKALAAEGIKVVDVAVTGADGAKAQLAERIPQAIEELRAINPDLNDVLFWMTSSTAVFSNIKTVNTYSGAIPVVASIPNAVVEGEDSAVLGIGIDRRSNAHQAALYAIQMLTQNTPPEKFEVGIVTPPDIAVNFLVARRIGLKIPFRFFENASFIYDYSGRVVRDFGVKVAH